MEKTSGLDKKDIAKLKQKLLKKKGQLENELADFAEKVKGDWKVKYENIGDDWDDNAYEVTDYATKIPLEETLEERLKEINAALKRMNEKIYGICQNCGEPISTGRLKAKPETTTCLKHAR